MSRAEAERFQTLFDVSRETLGRLGRYEELLKKWNPAINLVSKPTLDEVWSRHFIDSAQLFNLAPAEVKTWADLGAGGGFPGLVIAILAKENAPDLEVVLVESDRRKSAFLASVSRELELKTRVLAKRIEEIAPLHADVLSARALAALQDLLGFAERHLRPGGVALFPKGVRWQEELALARQSWSFDCEASPSLSDPNSIVLKINGAQRV